MRLCNKRCLFWLIASSAIFAPGAWANDTAGWFAGVRFGHELAEVDFAKTVIYNAGALSEHPAASTQTARDSANNGFNAFSANLGYRAFLSDRVYLSGEIEGAVYSNTVKGFLRGTRTGDVRGITIPSPNVFPGTWAVDKNHGLGFNARLGYVPEGLAFLGEGRSVYLISGVKWLNATFEAAYDNTPGRANVPSGTLDECLQRQEGCAVSIVRGVVRKTRNAVPWLIGGGVEFGSSTNRFDVRIQYSTWSMDYNEGDGSSPGTPQLPHNFDVDEVAISLGYTRSFNLGM